ncbi:MAG: aspartate 1-decarboxylase [Candidatus Zophobacter franzmannii]|nr:aspartate 1-decarboxylase [Candidatus Zophobacter franzmannii]
MLRTMLYAKIHRATVSETDLNYVGSITIDKDLLDETGILPNEKVEIYDIDNGNRFATYVIEGEAGSGVIGVNGAAARLVRRGDKVIIVSFVEMHPEEIEGHKPSIVVVNNENKVIDRK